MAKKVWKHPALSGALYVNVIFELPVKNNRLWGKPHDKRPDLDNFCKSTLDALDTILWNDDAQIARLEASKFYASTGKIIIEIKQL